MQWRCRESMDNQRMICLQGDTHGGEATASSVPRKWLAWHHPNPKGSVSLSMPLTASSTTTSVPIWRHMKHQTRSQGPKWCRHNLPDPVLVAKITNASMRDPEKTYSTLPLPPPVPESKSWTTKDLAKTSRLPSTHENKVSRSPLSRPRRSSQQRWGNLSEAWIWGACLLLSLHLLWWQGFYGRFHMRSRKPITTITVCGISH